MNDVNDKKEAVEPWSLILIILTFILGTVMLHFDFCIFPWFLSSYKEWYINASNTTYFHSLVGMLAFIFMIGTPLGIIGLSLFKFYEYLKYKLPSGNRTLKQTDNHHKNTPRST